MKNVHIDILDLSQILFYYNAQDPQKPKTGATIKIRTCSFSHKNKKAFHRQIPCMCKDPYV